MFKTTKDKTAKKEYKPYSFLVGSVAETLVKQLFLSLDYDVFPFGMENTVPEIKGRLNGNISDSASVIRNMPDFVVLKENQPILIEVKYRSNGSFKYQDLIKKYSDYPYKDVLVVLVSQQHIKASFLEDLKDKPFTSSSTNYLGSVRELRFTKEEKQKIISFCDYAKHFFTGVENFRL